MADKDETKELPLEERAKIGIKEDFKVEDCKKKKFGKEYYLCKEPEKAPLCTYALHTPDGCYYCPRKK